MNDPQPATQDDLSDAPGTAIKPGVGTPDDAIAKQRRVSDGARTPVLPDCCNFGIALRIVAPLNMAAFVFAVALSNGFIDAINRFVDIALLLEPITLASLVILCLVRKRVNGFRVPLQWLVALAVPVAFSLPVAWLSFSLLAGANFTGSQAWWIAVRVLLTLSIAWGVVEFLRLRARAYSPSLAEARLQALQARIRPHFLFNSLNTVLGLMRSDPRRAERTLENLADLFRVFMRDTRELVPLDEEVVTCQQYLAIEQLRLGERLQISWDLAEMAGDALLPSLLLQPLVENSVHHGIEPRTEPGEIWIKISKPGERVRVEIVNPVAVSQNAIRPGNQMALSNVRERLMLLYDMEAELKTTEEGGSFRLLLEFPYRKEKRRRDVRRHFNPDR
jgi:two-component system, LytTR family, sensor histidine kinase AlgZ